MRLEACVVACLISGCSGSDPQPSPIVMTDGGGEGGSDAGNRDAGDGDAGGRDAGATARACNDSPFAGRYLWGIGNCEVGSATAFDALSCESRLCEGGSPCPDTRTFRVDGLRLIHAGSGSSETFTHAYDCSRMVPEERDRCACVNELLSMNPDVYMNMVEVDHVSEDWTYLASDRPWPGSEGCVAAHTAGTLGVTFPTCWATL